MRSVQNGAFFGMNTECCKYPFTFKNAKKQSDQQVDAKRRAGKKWQNRNKVIYRKEIGESNM